MLLKILRSLREYPIFEGIDSIDTLKRVIFNKEEYLPQEFSEILTSEESEILTSSESEILTSPKREKNEDINLELNISTAIFTYIQSRIADILLSETGDIIPETETEGSVISDYNLAQDLILLYPEVQQDISYLIISRVRWLYQKQLWFDECDLEGYSVPSRQVPRKVIELIRLRISENEKTVKTRLYENLVISCHECCVLYSHSPTNYEGIFNLIKSPFCKLILGVSNSFDNLADFVISKQQKCWKPFIAKDNHFQPVEEDYLRVFDELLDDDEELLSLTSSLTLKRAKKVYYIRDVIDRSDSLKDLSKDISETQDLSFEKDTSIRNDNQVTSPIPIPHSNLLKENFSFYFPENYIDRKTHNTNPLVKSFFPHSQIDSREEVK